MAERSKQSMLIHVVAIAFIMGRLIIREKTGFGLIVAIAIADAVLFSAVLDYDNSTAWGIVFTILRSLAFICLITAFQRKIHQPATFPSIARALKLGWAEPIYTILSYIIFMIITIIMTSPFLFYTLFMLFWISEHGDFNFQLLLILLLPIFLIGIGPMTVHLPRIANGIIADFSGTLNATKGCRMAITLHFVLIHLPMAFTVFVTAFFFPDFYMELMQSETDTATLLGGLFILFNALYNALYFAHLIALSSASAFYIFADDPSGLRHLPPKAENLT